MRAIGCGSVVCTGLNRDTIVWRPRGRQRRDRDAARGERTATPFAEPARLGSAPSRSSTAPPDDLAAGDGSCRACLPPISTCSRSTCCFEPVGQFRSGRRSTDTETEGVRLTSDLRALVERGSPISLDAHCPRSVRQLGRALATGRARRRDAPRQRGRAHNAARDAADRLPRREGDRWQVRLCDPAPVAAAARSADVGLSSAARAASSRFVHRHARVAGAAAPANRVARARRPPGCARRRGPSRPGIGRRPGRGPVAVAAARGRSRLGNWPRPGVTFATGRWRTIRAATESAAATQLSESGTRRMGRI